MSRKTLTAALAGFASGAAGYVARKWESDRAEAAQAKRDERLAEIQRQATAQAQGFQAEQGQLSREHASAEAQLSREQQTALATQQQQAQSDNLAKQLAAQERIAAQNEAGQNSRHAQSMATQRAGIAQSAGRGTMYADQDGASYRITDDAAGDAQIQQLNSQGKKLRMMSAYPDRYDQPEPMAVPGRPGTRPGAPKVETLTRDASGRLILAPSK